MVRTPVVELVVVEWKGKSPRLRLDATRKTSDNCRYEVNSMGFKWERTGRSSRHIPFDWSGSW